MLVDKLVNNEKERNLIILKVDIDAVENPLTCMKNEVQRTTQKLPTPSLLKITTPQNDK